VCLPDVADHAMCMCDEIATDASIEPHNHNDCGVSTVGLVVHVCEFGYAYPVHAVSGASLMVRYGRQQAQRLVHHHMDSSMRRA